MIIIINSYYYLKLIKKKEGYGFKYLPVLDKFGQMWINHKTRNRELAIQEKYGKIMEYLIQKKY